MGHSRQLEAPPNLHWIPTWMPVSLTCTIGLWKHMCKCIVNNTLLCEWTAFTLYKRSWRNSSGWVSGCRARTWRPGDPACTPLWKTEFMVQPLPPSQETMDGLQTTTHVRRGRHKHVLSGNQPPRTRARAKPGTWPSGGHAPLPAMGESLMSRANFPRTHRPKDAQRSHQAGWGKAK